MVELEAVAFNHEPGSATRDALTIRRNAAEGVAVPEWRRGASLRPEDSPVAYATGETRGNTITILAKFFSRDPGLRSSEVRAVRLHPIPPAPWWPYPLPLPPSPSLWSYLSLYYPWYAYSLWPAAAAGGASAREEVEARQVDFGPGGESDFEMFSLRNPSWLARGVGVEDVVWRWQARPTPGHPWADFATTTHRMYTVLEVPAAPWQQVPGHPGNTQLPWTDVLEFACRWARGARTLDEAARGVTRAVHALGPELLEYGCPIFAATQYAMPWPYFNCSAFLERLRGGIGRGRYVNCTDCASIVSTFANALGCDLWQSRMFGRLPFALNPVLALGTGTWLPACGFGSFNYHEVAWKGACTADDEVFDASLRVDGDLDPTRAPHRPLLATSLRFGRRGDGQYRDRLATVSGRRDCRPQPGTRVRRLVY